MKCLYCGEENKEGAKFCEFCGKSLLVSSSQSSSKTLRCPYCNEEVKENDRFCSNCGKELVLREKEGMKKPKSKSSILVVVLLLIVANVLLQASMIYSSSIVSSMRIVGKWRIVSQETRYPSGKKEFYQMPPGTDLFYDFSKDGTVLIYGYENGRVVPSSQAKWELKGNELTIYSGPPNNEVYKINFRSNKLVLTTLKSNVTPLSDDGEKGTVIIFLERVKEE